MILKKLSLTNFRNFSKEEFLFSPQVSLIVGPNTSGKTNLIEAIYLLSTGKSMRASLEAEMIRWGESWARVEAILRPDPAEENLQGLGPPTLKVKESAGRTTAADLGIDFSVSSELKPDETKPEGLGDLNPSGLESLKGLEVFIERGDDNHSRKKFKINGVKKDLGEFQGSFRVVIFSPESLQLVLGSPNRRRNYLDRVLSSLDTFYFRALDEYQKVVKNRNQLLWQIRERGIPRERLEFWDGKLFNLGEEIFAKRRELISDLNQKLSDLGLGVTLSYQPSVLDKNLYEERLSEEIGKAATLWGPHRDDLIFLRKRIQTDKDTDLSRFGSRGEQREAVFALCLSELEVVSGRTGERPILLLDDIFSELDESHRKRVLEVLPKQQTIITSAEPELLNSGLKKEAKVIKLG